MRRAREGRREQPQQGTALLFGRDDELARVRRWIAHGASGVLRGEPGIGKSAILAAALAGRSDDLVLNGVAVLASVPYSPIRVARPDLSVDHRPGELAELLGRCTPPGAYVVVDDLQWCDEDTRAVLAELAMRRPFLATVRAAMGAAESLLDTIASVVEVVDIGPLERTAAVDLVRALRPGAPNSDVDRAVEAAAGVPLTLQLVARGRSVGVDAHAAAARAVSELDADARVDLARAALAGTPVVIDGAHRAALVQRGLIRVDGDGRASPCHDLIASAVLEVVDDATRRRLHAELAEAADDVAARAMHLAAAGDRPGAVRAAAAAADRAVTVWARAEALRVLAEQTEPGDPAANRAAADALSLAGRYRDALDLLGASGAPAATSDDALIRARSHWALTDIDAARAAIETGLADSTADLDTSAELLSLRSRIRGRVDWDLSAAIADGRRAVALAEQAGGRHSAGAHSALGLALFMAGDPSWQPELERAAEQSIADDDMHSAASVYDTMFFGHLLAGDPSCCAPLATEMISLTEQSSAAWNGYFRAVALLARVNVEGDHRAVLDEVRVLGTRRLTVKAGEAMRTAQVLAVLDGGDDLDAVELGEASLRQASDDSARSTASWVLAEALWLAGDAERAVAISDACLDLGVGGFPGAVNAAIAGTWARAELRRPTDARTLAAATSGFANLEPARVEAEAFAATAPEEARALFARAGAAWSRISARASLRARWAAISCALEAGLEVPEPEFRSLERATVALGIVWLDRRLDASFRRAGLRRAVLLEGRPSSADEVLSRVARGQTTAQISRSLCLEPTTIETHVRNAMQRTGARTRLHAAALGLGSAADPAAPARASLWSTTNEGELRLGTDAPQAPARTVKLAALTTMPWRLDATSVVTGEVECDDDVAAVVLAILRGAAVDVHVPAARSGARAALLDALARIGSVVTARDPSASPVLDSEDQRLVAVLAAGGSLEDAATALGYSRRTVQRRLVRLRKTVGAATNREAVIIATRR